MAKTKTKTPTAKPAPTAKPTPTPEAPQNTVPDFAIIQGTIYRASAIDALEVHQEDDLRVTFAMSGRIITISFTEPKDAKESHRLLAYIMTGTDLYAAQPEAAQPEAAPADPDMEAPTGEDDEGTNA